MSKADQIFVNMCTDIIENGFSSEGQTVRAKWADGIPAHTIKQFGVVNRYNLAEEFPALTLRPTAIKSCVDEVLWIWQKKSNQARAQAILRSKALKRSLRIKSLPLAVHVT